MPSRMRLCVLAALILVLGVGAAAGSALAATSALWADVSASAVAPAGERLITPLRYRTVEVRPGALAGLLARAPLEGTRAAANRAVIELPLPDGAFGRFSIVESPILAPELGAKYPEIRTYAGYGLDDPSATVRLDVTPAGFHGLILSARGTVYIDPFQRGDVLHYQSYYKRDFVSEKTLGGCILLDDDGMAEKIAELEAQGALTSGTQLRTYRTAVAATGEYTQFHGGTVALGLAAVTTTVNRVTGVYEREVSCRMQLVANNDLIIYTNSATDPYTNNDGVAMLSQNQSTLDSVIGSANYDHGHVVSTGGGGVARLGVVCRSGLKAQGVTGSPQPIGDPFDIDYVAHEMGHQFGGNHTFNGTYGSCNGNRVASAAYEPGSGSTIMAYAGICGQDNLQAHSDDYFHFYSIKEIVTYTTLGSGNSCPVTTPTGAIEPAVDAGVGGFTIPINTPFELTATGSGTGSLTYCWEESDLGPAGHPDSPSGNAPIFRSFDPVASPWRTFPKLSDLLNNHHTKGELLPSYARNLSFKCTLRDVQAGGVGVSADSIAFAVAAVGPFLVTYPDSGATWTGGTQQTVTWNVAGTGAAPINCTQVDILLSTDGGHTFDTMLAAATPNDGSQAVTVPDAPTTTARIKVKAANSIFFDISNLNFEILAATDVATRPPVSSGLQLLGSRPNPSSKETTIGFAMPQAGTVTLRVYDAAGRFVRALVQGEVPAGDQQAVWDGRDAQGQPVSSGVYFYRLEALGQALAGRMTLIR